MFGLPKIIKPWICGIVFAGLLTGCRLFHPSEVQVAVVSARAAVKKDQSLQAVHRMLLGRGIAHKIVQFRYDVGERPLIPPIGNAEVSLGATPFVIPFTRSHRRERTGILYRDDSHRLDPWWYVDAEVNRPIWLPSDRADWQISYAMRRRIELLRVEEFNRAIDGMAKASGNTETTKTDWKERFLQVHGSEFNPGSSIDLAKMHALRGR